jgi:hypothetical protein
VTETVHSAGASVATGQFQVGLTDNATYQRTAPVLIRAIGYLPLENVTINLTQGSTSVPSFPTTQKADTNGVIALSWQTSIGTPLGSYFLTISGATSTKTSPDSQPFTVYPTNVTISGLWLNSGTIERSQTLEFRFNATYLNGSPAFSGSAPIRVTEPNGTNHTITASYDSSLQTFRAFYATTLSSTTGVWIGTVDVNSFGDGLNNGGPLSPVFTNFNVQRASLTAWFTTRREVNGRAATRSMRQIHQEPGSFQLPLLMDMETLARIPLLSPSTRQALRTRLSRSSPVGPSGSLYLH